MINESEYELWKSLDYAIFTEDEASNSAHGFKRLSAQYAKEKSSLGHYLSSLREFEEWTVEEMAKAAGVAADVWRAWEIDYLTPSEEQLEIVAERLQWRSRKRAIAKQLGKEAPLYRLRRLTEFKPELLAARGELNPSAVAWRSIDKSTQAKIICWGQARGYDFPRDLNSFLQELRTDDEAREAWISEIIGG